MEFSRNFSCVRIPGSGPDHGFLEATPPASVDKRLYFLRRTAAFKLCHRTDKAVRLTYHLKASNQLTIFIFLLLKQLMEQRRALTEYFS